MTPEELIRKRKREELLKRANAARPTTPTDGEQLVSENTKETLKAAGHWAGVIGKRATELTQKGVVAAAEKAKEVKATVDAKRAKIAEERVQATEAKSNIPTVQPAEVDVATNFLRSEGEGFLVADGMGQMAQDLVLVDGGGGVDKAPFAEMAAEDLVDALAVQESATRDGEAEAVDVDEARPEPARTEQPPVVEAPRWAPQVDALSDLPADAAEVSPVTDHDSMGQDAAPQEAPQPKPRSRWPWVVGGVVAVALVAGTIYFLLGKNDNPAPSTPAPAASVVSPQQVTPAPAITPEQVPEGVKADVVAPVPTALPAQQVTPAPAIEKPEPVAAPVVSASAPKKAQPKPSPKKAPAPAGEPRSDWQQKANADLDAWAEKSGIK